MDRDSYLAVRNAYLSVDALNRWQGYEASLAIMTKRGANINQSFTHQRQGLNPADRHPRPNMQTADLILQIEAQRDLMMAVATGGPRIQEVNTEYQQRRVFIRSRLDKLNSLRATVSCRKAWSAARRGH
jgi:hypothetical protein